MVLRSCKIYFLYTVRPASAASVASPAARRGYRALISLASNRVTVLWLIKFLCNFTIQCLSFEPFGSMAFSFAG